MRNIPILSFLLASVLILQGFAAEKPTCAVATFEARGGVSPDEAATLSDCLESELIRLDQFAMVARARMPEIVAAQQMSLACAETACAIELGKILSVQYIVFGSVSKVGSTHVLLATLANVETAALERTARFEQSAGIDELLKTGIPSIARQLSNTEPPGVPSSTPSPSQSLFKKNWPWLVGGATLVAGGVAIAVGGSGESSTDGGTSTTSGGGAGDDLSNTSLTGSWRGTSASGQVRSTLNLRQNGTSISGTLYWPGEDGRSADGWVSGQSVTLYIGGGDIWNMTWRGNTLRGTAQKADGGTYAVNFSR